MPKLGLWENAIKQSADPERAREYGVQLAELRPEYFTNLSSDQARVVAALLSGSKALSELLIAKPEWLDVIEFSLLENPRRKEGLQRDIAKFLKPGLETKDYSSVLRQLRELKQREMLRIAARDLARLGNVPQITEEISNVADVCLHTVYQVALQQLTEKFGTPYAHDPATEKWIESSFCVLGMGKLGGQELNYSSDIDVLFVYSGEGACFKTKPTKNTKPLRATPNHQFYAKLAEAVIAECTRMTAEGFLFRIDMRLRPEGKTAPLARALSSYETYYAQWGQTWERMMLIKARCVAGDQGLGAEFMEMIQPFRYPRSISEQVPREVAEMKQRIENEIIKTGELERNVKLGRGGIREIEFLVQTQQVLQAGRMPFLQGSKTLPALEKLSDYKLIEKPEAARLKAAYCFLRDVEHRLQMEDNRQTHTIPEHKPTRIRLAKLMGFPDLKSFEAELQTINDDVRKAYDRFINPIASDGNAGAVRNSLPSDVAGAPDEWKKVLRAHSFRDPDHCLKLVQEFVHGPGFGHRSSRTIDHALQLLARMLEACPRGDAAPPEPFLSDPDRVLARLDSFVSRYGAQSMLYDAWVSNPSLFRLLLLAFDRSEFLAELAIRVPDLIDEIEQSGQLRRKRNTEQILEDLRAGAKEEDQHRWLRRYYQAEQMRIGLRDILDLADPEQTQSELTALADAFLTYALEVVLRKHRIKKAPFAIFGLGKLGGRELIYASDLDIIFVAESKNANLPALQKVAAQFLELLSKRTEDGATFEADARLRPDGEKGLLVNTLDAYRDYYLKRAMLWELQSLSRFRPICGNATVQKSFSDMAVEMVSFNSGKKKAAAFTANWKSEVHRMRMRIEKERTPAGQDKLAIKTGRGGLMDVEFVAQALSLENGWHEPNTLSAVARAGGENVISPESAKILSENYRKLMQVERILRRWSFEPESVLPVDAAAFYRVAVRCGYKDAATFQDVVLAQRGAIRREYLKMFDAEAK
ncbi:MAG TPA: bifunctional [glutamate--ammonia ligase]-adenylyl-L-tyrosine phosphorylase/[glutamate--ammonia-ligase] adenylyltransferase [Verrucomicrobiae bacterium]